MQIISERIADDLFFIFISSVLNSPLFYHPNYRLSIIILLFFDKFIVSGTQRQQKSRVPEETRNNDKQFYTIEVINVITQERAETI